MMGPRLPEKPCPRRCRGDLFSRLPFESCPPKYTLWIVIEHISSPLHYVAYVQYADGVWRKFGDSVVSEVSFREVAQRQAYVAMYMLSSHVINEQNGKGTSGPAFGEKMEIPPKTSVAVTITEPG